MTETSFDFVFGPPSLLFHDIDGCDWTMDTSGQSIGMVHILSLAHEAFCEGERPGFVHVSAEDLCNYHVGHEIHQWGRVAQVWPAEGKIGVQSTEGHWRWFDLDERDEITAEVVEPPFG